MTPTIIGLTGKAGSGKDTAADALVARLGFRKFHFSDALKEGLCAMFGWHHGKIYDDRIWREANVEIDGVSLPSPRYMMQTIGTEWGRRMIHPDVWVLATASRIASANPVCERVVIPDLRFDNEAEWITKQGGLILEVTRPGQAGSAGAHASEAGIDHSYVYECFHNNGSIEALQSWAVAMANWKLRLPR